MFMEITKKRITRISPTYLVVLGLAVAAVLVASGCDQASQAQPSEATVADAPKNSQTEMPAVEDEMPAWAEDSELIRKLYEQTRNLPPRLFGSNPPPPRYDELLAQANGWSDEELEHQLRILLERYRIEKEWDEFFLLTMTSESRRINQMLRWPDELGDENVLIAPAVRSGVMFISSELNDSTGINDAAGLANNRAFRTLIYARAAGWIEELTKRRKRFTRRLLEDVYKVAPNTGGLQEIWDPAKDRVLELEDLLPVENNPNQ